MHEWSQIESDTQILRHAYLGWPRLPSGDALVFIDQRLVCGSERVPDDTYHLVEVCSVIERTPPEDLIALWHELYRVTRAHGRVVVSGVYWSSVLVSADPTRYRGLSEQTFRYLSPAEREVLAAEDDGPALGLLRGVDMRAERVTRVTEPDWDTRSDDAKNWGGLHSNNVVRSIEVSLVVSKG